MLSPGGTSGPVAPVGKEVSYAMSEERRFSDHDLSAFIMGEGTPEEREAIQNAIESSPELRQTYDALLETWNLLDGYRIPHPPPGGLEDLHHRLEIHPLVQRKPKPPRVVRSWQIAAVAACLLLAVGIPVFMFHGGLNSEKTDVVHVLMPELPTVAATPAAPSNGSGLASIPPRRAPARRFLAGQDGNLHAGVTIVVDSVTEWDDPVVRVDDLKDLSDLNLEDYAKTNFEFHGASPVPVEWEVVPVSAGPM
jgi:hypothetical protein